MADISSGDEFVGPQKPKRTYVRGNPEACKEELQRILKDGPQPSKLVLAAMMGQGYTKSHVYSAYRMLNLNSSVRGKGFRNETVWSLLPIVEKEVIREIQVPVPVKAVAKKKKAVKRIPRAAMATEYKKNRPSAIDNAERELVEVKKALVKFADSLSSYIVTRGF